MPLPNLQLNCEQLQALIVAAFPKSRSGKVMCVEAAELGWVRTRVPFSSAMIRPGNVLSGPSLMLAADTAMYVAVLAHAGPALMAVTSDMQLRFINKALPGDLLATARILKWGRRQVVMECTVASSAAPEVIALHSTGSYALPEPKPKPVP